MVNARRQQKSILAIEALGIVAVTPGFAVARDQVLDAIDARDPTSFLNLPNALLEQPLPAPSDDQSGLLRFVDTLLLDRLDQMLLPLDLALRRRARQIAPRLVEKLRIQDELSLGRVHQT